MAVKISKRTREQAALICAIAVSEEGRRSASERIYGYEILQPTHLGGSGA